MEIELNQQVQTPEQMNTKRDIRKKIFWGIVAFIIMIIIVIIANQFYNLSLPQDRLNQALGSSSQ